MLKSIFMAVENSSTKSQIEHALSWRYAVKKFDANKELSENQLRSLTASLCLTPTSMGLQLMQFIVVSDPEVKQALLPLTYNQRQVVDCSHLIIFCRIDEVKEEHIMSYVHQTAIIRGLDKNSPQLARFETMLRSSLKMSATQQIKWMENQVYLALGNFLTACAVEAIDACPMEGFMPDKVNELLQLKDKGLNCVVLCPVGFRSEDDKYATFPKVRRPNSELIHYL
jgi:nitroreductase / dihydropteridine reductase